MIYVEFEIDADNVLYFALASFRGVIIGAVHPGSDTAADNDPGQRGIASFFAANV